MVGNRRHRAAQLIERFHDGLAWLAQMVMFVMLGLLVTPSDLLPTLIPAVLIAAFLVVVARPVAVVLCLLPFRFAWNELAFIAWVGLRGAVAIFLGTIPVLAGVDERLDLLRGRLRGRAHLADRPGLDAGARRRACSTSSCRRGRRAGRADRRSTCRPRAGAIF